MFIAAFFVLTASVCHASDILYVLDVSVDTELKRISGTANISSTSLQELTLGVRNLECVSIDGRKAPESFSGPIVVEVGGKNGPVTIQYEAEFSETSAGLIDATHVFLMTDWYPVPDKPVHYTLSATLPRNFTAVSEAELVTTAFSEELATHLFHFPHPLDALHLAASSRYEIQKDTLGNITIEAIFFSEDTALADSYIESAKTYLTYYLPSLKTSGPPVIPCPPLPYWGGMWLDCRLSRIRPCPMRSYTSGSAIMSISTTATETGPRG